MVAQIAENGGMHSWFLIFVVHQGNLDISFVFHFNEMKQGTREFMFYEDNIFLL